MGLRFTTDVGVADWLAHSATPWDRLVRFGPPGYAAYARLRFVPDPAWPGQQESDVDVPDDHPADLDQARRALAVLAGFTSSPDDCWYCTWEGWGTLPSAVGANPLVVVPHRRYALVRGTLADLADWPDLPGTGPAPPAFAWPADRRWVFTSDVDPHWAGIAASEAAISALIADPALDVVVTDPLVEPPAYR